MLQCMNLPENDKKVNSTALKGFIVSDAHFGWVHHEQPAPEVQSLMMERIISRFPDLDVFIDTGDAHHGALKGENGDKARGQWTDIIPGGSGTVPFYYVAGNHEIIGTLEQYDQEWLCNEMGSVTCRPYYSFDLKGIHFISLPELIQPTYISNETIEWLKLDLEVNKNQTVIILSHNNIKETTTPMGEPGYRGVVNSGEMQHLFRKYPGIIAWMHGHNHTYEIVRSNEMIYVSNGRIGGFVPSLTWGEAGQGHLGGIYFEVRKDKFIVKAYSATKEKFLDELGYPHLSSEIQIATSFNSQTRPAYSFGYGGMIHGQRIPAFLHHASLEKNNEIVVKNLNETAFNEDPTFSLFEFRDAGKSRYQWLLMGTSIGTPNYFEKENKLWRWENPGIRLLAQENDNYPVIVSIPDRRFERFCYYRCVPGFTYKAVLNLEAKGGGQQLGIEYTCHDREGNKLATLNGPVWILEQGEKTYNCSLTIPQFSEHRNIYNDPESDNLIQITVKAIFKRMHNDVIIRKFDIMLHPGDKNLAHQDNKPSSVGSIHGNLPADLNDTDINVIHEADGRMVIQSDTSCHQRTVWLLRQNNIDWQVRNATVSDLGNYLEINGLRNTWTFRKEIIIVPVQREEKMFVHRLSNIEKSRIYPLNRNNRYLRIEVLKCAGQGEVIIYSTRRPKKITGVTGWSYEKNRVVIPVTQETEIILYT